MSDLYQAVQEVLHDQPVPEEILQYIEVLAQDVSTAVEHCTPYGKRLKLLANKPDDLYYAYVWRMARFHSGEDMRRPIQCFFDLSQAIQEDFGVRIDFFLIDETRKHLLDELDALADRVLESIGIGTDHAARHWRSVLGEMRP